MEYIEVMSLAVFFIVEYCTGLPLPLYYTHDQFWREERKNKREGEEVP